jgi:hypothetical protein
LYDACIVVVCPELAGMHLDELPVCDHAWLMVAIESSLFSQVGLTCERKIIDSVSFITKRYCGKGGRES